MASACPYPHIISLVFKNMVPIYSCVKDGQSKHISVNIAPILTISRMENIYNAPPEWPPREFLEKIDLAVLDAKNHVFSTWKIVLSLSTS